MSCFSKSISVSREWDEEENPVPKPEQIKEILYWYASDYCDVFYADRILEQMDPSADFAVQIIEKADLDEDDYLYEFGEYISRMNLEQLII